MPKPNYPAYEEGQTYTLCDETWVWHFDKDSEPLFSVSKGGYSVASGLNRKEAARMGGLLLLDSCCNEVRLTPCTPSGDWFLEEKKKKEEEVDA